MKNKLVILILSLGLFFGAYGTVQASVGFVPQVGIPDSEFQVGKPVAVGSERDGKVTSDLLARYIRSFYVYGLNIVGVLAVLFLMAGGVLWIVSGGNESKIANAKKMISGALVGGALLVGAYFIVNTINPELTKLPVISLTKIEPKKIQDDIDSRFLLDAEKVTYVCLHRDQTCEHTNPPSLNMDLSVCRERKGASPSCPADETIWCCGMNNNTQANADKMCVGKRNGDPCKITETGSLGSGFCQNNKCQPCFIAGQQCNNDYECRSGSLLLCGYGEASGISFPSKCNRGYCAGIDVSKAGDSCGPLYQGKCMTSCTGDLKRYTGGTECGSGLKCCK